MLDNKSFQPELSPELLNSKPPSKPAAMLDEDSNNNFRLNPQSSFWIERKRAVVFCLEDAIIVFQQGDSDMKVLCVEGNRCLWITNLKQSHGFYKMES